MACLIANKTANQRLRAHQGAGNEVEKMEQATPVDTNPV